MGSLEEKIIELEKRLEKLEQEVFGRKKTVAEPQLAEQRALELEDLEIPTDILAALRARIRKVGYWNLVLILLYYASQSLTYSHMMSISKELKKPISYEWLNTEFHRAPYSGLVRSDPIPGSTEKMYSLNEPGRKKAETVLDELKAAVK